MTTVMVPIVPPEPKDMALRCKKAFAARRIKLPDHWPDFFPTGGLPQRQFVKAIPTADHGVPLPEMGHDLLFDYYLPIKLHANQVRVMSRSYADFFDGISQAICSAWNTWQKTAVMMGVTYTAGMALGGSLQGAPLTPLIMSLGPKIHWTQPVAMALGNLWTQFQASLTFAGAPLFMGNMAMPIPPGMDMVPGMSASGPLGLKVACPALVPLTKEIVAQEMINQTPDVRKSGPHVTEVFESLADAFVQCLGLWTNATVINSTAFMINGVNPSMAPIPRTVATVLPSTGPVFTTMPVPIPQEVDLAASSRAG
jgi:hypothetical protein